MNHLVMYTNPSMYRMQVKEGKKVEEFTVSELVRTVAPALDAASKKPVKLVRNKSKYGPRQEYVIMSWKKYEALARVVFESRLR